MEYNLIKMNISGGILSPGDLRNLLSTAKKCRCENIHLGERQNLYLHVDPSEIEILKKDFEHFGFDFEIDDNQHPNILSSYVSEGIFTSYNNWVSEGVYRDILDAFNYKPKLKINIVDNTQGLIPLFTGNFNFISSDSPNFWYLYLRRKSEQNLECWPELIYSNDISFLSETLEKLLLENNRYSLNQLQEKVNEVHKLITLPKETDLILPPVRLPYYEGLNKSGDLFWLGIYRRNNDFSIQFLESVCNLCAQTKLGLIQLTSWKSLLIKGIAEEDRIKWEKLLGKHSINIRHSSVELNWQIKDGDMEALKLKKFIIKKLDKNDVRTYGLSFAIRSGFMNVSTSVIIDKKVIEMVEGETKSKVVYDIRYSEGFNPHKQSYTLFASEIAKDDLKNKIVELCKVYYEQLNNEPVEFPVNKDEKECTLVSTVHQCPHCYSIYDKKYGDILAGIPPGVAFEALDDSYSCALCETSKKEFVEKELEFNL